MPDQFDPTNFVLFEDIDDMLQRVHYAFPVNGTTFAKEIDSFITKSKIYLGHDDKLPPGKKLQFGPKGGRYYESDLEVYHHVWERVRDRKVKEEQIINAIKFLDTKNLPTIPWWYKVKEDGIIVGQGEKVQTVLKPNMVPKGIEIQED